MYGEVYFLRAYYYFELVKFFGDVPLFTEARLTAGEAGTLTRTPKEDCLLYTSPSPRDMRRSRMPSSA